MWYISLPLWLNRLDDNSVEVLNALLCVVYNGKFVDVFTLKLSQKVGKMREGPGFDAGSGKSEPMEAAGDRRLGTCREAEPKLLNDALIL
jgi:hypothetical protein